MPISGDPFAGSGAGTVKCSESRPLLQEIAKLFSDFPGRSGGHRRRGRLVLAGIPDHVGLAVLKDWHADLMASAADPESGYGFDHVRLDVRIVRQLAAAKVPLTTLGSVLQDRLRDAAR